MERKDYIDTFGAASLIGFSLLMAFNQVVIKVVNDGLQPVFFAGVRSAGAVLCIWLWLRLRGQRLAFEKGTIGAGFLIGSVFAIEFVFLFLALDLTTVIRTSVIFYSMPVWLALAAHFLLPGERLTGPRALGLVLAFGGVSLAIIDRGADGGEASLVGDLCALAGALGWAGVALCARTTAISRVRPEMQQFWQVMVSAPVLLLAAVVFGPPYVRELEPIHLWGLAFQIVVVASAGFTFWFWLLSIYPAAGVASFSFLSPLFGVALGWLILGETMRSSLIGAVVLVAAGLILINRTQPSSASTAV